MLFSKGDVHLTSPSLFGSVRSHQSDKIRPWVSQEWVPRKSPCFETRALPVVKENWVLLAIACHCLDGVGLWQRNHL